MKALLIMGKALAERRVAPFGQPETVGASGGGEAVHA